KVEADAGIGEAAVDLLEAFECGGVDGVDGRTHQDDMLQLRPLRYERGDLVLEEARIGEIKAGVHPDRQDVWTREDGVPVDVAIVLGAWHLSDHGDVRLAGAMEVEQE